MNGQIQRLIEEAKKGVPHGLTPDKWLEVYHQKFAELIIKECTDLISVSIANYDDRALFNPRETTSRAIMLINEHFGVEK